VNYGLTTGDIVLAWLIFLVLSTCSSPFAVLIHKVGHAGVLKVNRSDAIFVCFARNDLPIDHPSHNLTVFREIGVLP
jgi:hypothetical protein